MGATTVSGTILGVDNAPRVGVYVYFRLKTTGTDSVATSTIDATRISAVTDSNGQFSTTLWDNGDSGVASIMEIQMPSGQRHEVIIPAGDAAIDVWDLIENYTVGTAAPQLPTNEALFMRKANNLSDLASLSTSRTNLGVAIGSDVQAWSAVLDATTASFLIADETKLDNAYSVGGTDVALADGGTGASTASAARTNLGLAIGTDVQAYDAQLADLAGLTPTDSTFIVGNGTNFVSESAATAQVSLGIVNGFGGGQIGSAATATEGGAVGDSASATYGGAVGSNAVATIGGAVGFFAVATDGFAGGNGATANGTGRVQLGAGINSTNNTIQFLSSGSVTATQFGKLAATTTSVTSTTYTALATDAVILVDDDTAAATVTITLPAAATAGDGFQLVVFKQGSTANIIIAGDGVETINGELTTRLIAQYESIKLITNGTAWFIIEA
jgi:hypothetical protein